MLLCAATDYFNSISGETFKTNALPSIFMSMTLYVTGKNSMTLCVTASMTLCVTASMTRYIMQSFV